MNNKKHSLTYPFKIMEKLFVFHILLSYFISHQGKPFLFNFGGIWTQFYLLIICTYFNIYAQYVASDSFMLLMLVKTPRTYIPRPRVLPATSRGEGSHYSRILTHWHGQAWNMSRFRPRRPLIPDPWVFLLCVSFIATTCKYVHFHSCSIIYYLAPRLDCKTLKER